MTDFNKDDVITVAKAVLESCLTWDEGCPHAMNAHDGFVCAHCDGGDNPESQTEEEFIHSQGCATLVARDLLTGTDISDIE